MGLRSLSVGILFVIAALATSCQQQYEFGLPESSEEFNSNIEYNNKVDMIFIVDDSMTMGLLQKKMADTIPGMIHALLGLKLDLQIAVISTSMGGDPYRGGRFVGEPKFLSNSTPGLASALAARLQMGADGRDTERGIESLLTVLSPGYLGHEGRGFLREGALLSIMAITNEDDKSAGDLHSYVAFFDNLKKPFDNGDRSWQFNLLGTLDTSGSCATNPEYGYSERSTKYIDLVQFSKGAMESVCARDYTPAVSNIRGRIVQILTDYRLRRIPDVSTIRVYSNGRVVPHSTTDGWEYIADLNVVRFYGSWIPAADVQIRVDFLPAKPD